MTKTPRPIKGLMQDPALVERFWSKVAIGTPEECWPWTRETNNQGYGRFAAIHYPSRVRLLAHRVALVLTEADEPPGALVLHSCDNPPCCNPRHLRFGTQLQNIHDAKTKGRMDTSGLDLAPTRQGAPYRAHCKQGHAFDDANTLVSCGRRICRTCLREAGRAFKMRQRMACEPWTCSACPAGTDCRPLWHRKPVSPGGRRRLGPDERKTHCPEGHPYDEANTYTGGGRRRCRTCHRARAAAHRIAAGITPRSVAA